MPPLVISVLIDLCSNHPYHMATMEALRHASDHLGAPVEVRAVQTDRVHGHGLVAEPGDAVVVGPGSPYRDQDTVHAVIRTARERGVPLVGT
jgi:CTP synthase (UTP-ammonia lyase)